jgi:hypothetical protein
MNYEFDLHKPGAARKGVAYPQNANKHHVDARQGFGLECHLGRVDHLADHQKEKVAMGVARPRLAMVSISD